MPKKPSAKPDPTLPKPLIKSYMKEEAAKIKKPTKRMPNGDKKY